MKSRERLKGTEVQQWQQKLETFEEVSQKVEKKTNDQKSWFPLTKGLKNYTKSFEIKIINKTEPLIQLNRSIDISKVVHMNQVIMMLRVNALTTEKRNQSIMEMERKANHEVMKGLDRMAGIIREQMWHEVSLPQKDNLLPSPDSH